MDSTFTPAASSSSCDTLLPPTRFYSPPSPSATSSSSHSVSATDDHAPLSPAAGTGLLIREAPVLSEIDMTVDYAAHDPSSSASPSGSSGKKGKARARSEAESWIQPPGRKLCRRHQRMADKGTNLLLQRVSIYKCRPHTRDEHHLTSPSLSFTDARLPSYHRARDCQQHLGLLQLILSSSSGVDPPRHAHNVLPIRAHSSL